jgi:flagellar biosynthesis/type III secretory pathway ATPase
MTRPPTKADHVDAERVPYRRFDLELEGAGSGQRIGIVPTRGFGGSVGLGWRTVHHEAGRTDAGLDGLRANAVHPLLLTKRHAARSMSVRVARDPSTSSKENHRAKITSRSGISRVYRPSDVAVFPL